MKFYLAALVSTAAGWWDTGHLLTARVAFDILNEKSPETVTAVNDLLAPLRKSDPGYTSSETAEHGFVECATWADEIKGKGGRW